MPSELGSHTRAHAHTQTVTNTWDLTTMPSNWKLDEFCLFRDLSTTILVTVGRDLRCLRSFQGAFFAKQFHHASPCAVPRIVLFDWRCVILPRQPWGVARRSKGNFRLNPIRLSRKAWRKRLHQRLRFSDGSAGKAFREVHTWSMPDRCP